MKTENKIRAIARRKIKVRITKRKRSAHGFWVYYYEHDSDDNDNLVQRCEPVPNKALALEVLRAKLRVLQQFVFSIDVREQP